MLATVKAYPIGKSVRKVGKDGKLGKIKYTFVNGIRQKDGMFSVCEVLSCWSDKDIQVKPNVEMDLTVDFMEMNGGMAMLVRYIGDIAVKSDESTLKPLDGGDLPF